MPRETFDPPLPHHRIRADPHTYGCSTVERRNRMRIELIVLSQGLKLISIMRFERSPQNTWKKSVNTLPLATQVSALFHKLKELSKESELVFLSAQSKTRNISDVCLLNGLRRLVYNRALYLDEQRDMMQKWGDYLIRWKLTTRDNGMFADTFLPYCWMDCVKAQWNADQTINCGLCRNWNNLLLNAKRYAQAWNKIRKKFGKLRLTKPKAMRCVQLISGSS